MQDITVVTCSVTASAKQYSDLYPSPYAARTTTTRTMGCAGHVARIGETRGPYRCLVGKSEGKRPHGTQGRRWNNIKMDLTG